MTRHKAQRHTAENLSVELNNVKAAVALIDDFGQMGCFAHTLNLAVKHAVEDDQQKVKDIVHYFNASTVALNEL